MQTTAEYGNAQMVVCLWQHMCALGTYASTALYFLSLATLYRYILHSAPSALWLSEPTANFHGH